MNDTLAWTKERLAALHIQGINERWTAVQEQLHPLFVQLAERIEALARERQPLLWGMYEISYKTARYINRGAGMRDPIDEYHMVLDRPPRGASIYVGVSGAEARVLVGLQLWRVRKSALASLWETARPLWAELLTTLPDVRFTRTHEPTEIWIEDYLRSRSTNYLWAGWSYSWQEFLERGTAGLDQIAAHVMELLPLNEALMETVEAYVATPPLYVRERRMPYQPSASEPPIEIVIKSIAERGFVYPESVIRSLHVALHTKPLVILSGISGTGKTRLTRLYADAVHGIAQDADNPFYLAVAVQPDWHNARDLLGYYNALTDRFQPTATLRLMLQAAADPAHPYFLCLDEMNLARPEYYLAPILSALETAEHSLDLGIPADTVQTTSGEVLRNPLRLPLNVHIIGTVNVDESTFTLSDKLLDRANMIELNAVDLETFRRTTAVPFNELTWQTLAQVQPILERAGQPFGYRTVTEIGRYVQEARGILDLGAALDLQIKQKLLPKLRGEDTPRFRAALRDLEQAIQAFPQAAAKVAEMRERLEREGYTDFY